MRRLVVLMALVIVVGFTVNSQASIYGATCVSQAQATDNPSQCLDCCNQKYGPAAARAALGTCLLYAPPEDLFLCLMANNVNYEACMADCDQAFVQITCSGNGCP